MSVVPSSTKSRCGEVSCLHCFLRDQQWLRPPYNCFLLAGLCWRLLFYGRAASHPALLRQASLSDAPASMAHSGSMRSGGSVHSEDAQDLLRRSLAERSGAGRVPAVRVCAQLSLKRRPGLASPVCLGEPIWRPSCQGSQQQVFRYTTRVQALLCCSVVERDGVGPGPAGRFPTSRLAQGFPCEMLRSPLLLTDFRQLRST